MERKIIGVDFGNSQSSIAIMEIGSAGMPELLNVGGGRNGVTIPTLLALDPNDDTVLEKSWLNTFENITMLTILILKITQRVLHILPHGQMSRLNC